MMKQAMKHNWYYLIVGVLLGLVQAGCNSQQSHVYQVSSSSEVRPETQAGSGGYNLRPTMASMSYSQTPTTTGPGSDQSLLSTYHIGPGDVLEISINQLLRLDSVEVLTVEVDESGRVMLPVLNNVTVGGLTCADARESLRRRLSQEFIRDPRVTVEVSEYRSKKVMVFGAVGSEGSIALRSDAAALMTVVADAGGVQNDHSEDLMIIRGGTERLGFVNGTFDIDRLINSEQGDYEIVRVPMSGLLGENGWQYNPLVYAGDIVYVPSIQNGTFYITGAVNHQGSMPLQRPMNVLQGVVAAGDTTRIAANDKCRVIRTMDDGQEVVINIDLAKIRNGQAENILLARNDVIVVPTDPFLAFLDALDRLVQRGINTGVDATYEPGVSN